jgi:putative sterol carrier protein
VAADLSLQALGGKHTIGITQVITESPDGTVTYHLQSGSGRVAFGAGPAEPEDVRLEQEYFSAVDVAMGEMTAEDAFITGCIRLSGNAPLLLECQAVFAGLDPIFTAVADRTDYGK